MCVPANCQAWAFVYTYMAVHCINDRRLKYIKLDKSKSRQVDAAWAEANLMLDFWKVCRNVKMQVDSTTMCCSHHGSASLNDPAIGY